MKNVIAVVREMLAKEVKVSSRGASPIVNQSQRNAIKAELQEALAKDFVEMFAKEFEDDFATGGLTADGVVVAFTHPLLIENGEEFVEIPLQFDVVIKNLDFDTQVEVEAYEDMKAQKELEKKEKELVKKEKIKRDAEKWEAKRLEKERKMQERLKAISK